MCLLPDSGRGLPETPNSYMRGFDELSWKFDFFFFLAKIVYRWPDSRKHAGNLMNDSFKFIILTSLKENKPKTSGLANYIF